MLCYVYSYVQLLELDTPLKAQINQIINKSINIITRKVNMSMWGLLFINYIFVTK